MAFSTSAYSNNNVPGNIDLAKFNIRESVATPRYALGTRVSIGNRTFRYAHFSAATTQAKLMSTDISLQSSTATTVLGIIAPISSNTTSDGTAGQRFLQFTLGSKTLDQLAGGYFMVSGDAGGTGAGGGYVYRIKGNSATSGPATGDVRLEFYDRIETEVTSGASVFVVGNLYADLVVNDHSATSDNFAVGVSCAVQAANDFGWVQTWGPTAIDSDGPLQNGQAISASGTAGASAPGRVDTYGGGGSAVSTLQEDTAIGFAFHDSVQSRTALVYLQIAP